MLKEALGTGATVEEAQQAAIAELAAPEEADVQFEVLELPVKKTFGLFGGSLAKVKAFYEIREEKAAPIVEREKKSAPTAQKKEEPVKKEEPIEPANVIALEDASDTLKKAYDYLLTIIKGMGLSKPTIEISEQGGEYYLSINCEDDYSLIIGRRGETLDSIQYLVRLVANRGKSDDEYLRISINIGNYRQKRENTLKDIARKSALRVIKYNRNVSLEPMNPFERRIVHTVISDMKGVSSHSVGMDAERRVIITPEGGSRPPQRSGYKKSGYNNNRPSTNRGPRPNNNNSDNRTKNQPSSPQKTQKVDVASTSLYGKIELDK
ncbi:MAG: KH domain-containing protein [Clostridia bacterium]|nr:KH domain-containing protein [Clostridia bacterium]